MSITLTAEQESIVANLIATGSFQTANEVLAAALKLLAAERESSHAWLAETRELLRQGIESLDRSRSTEYDRDNLHELFEEIKEQGRIDLELPK
jgi:antitoxin ParD1/3/4